MSLSLLLHNHCAAKKSFFFFFVEQLTFKLFLFSFNFPHTSLWIITSLTQLICKCRWCKHDDTEFEHVLCTCSSPPLQVQGAGQGCSGWCSVAGCQYQTCLSACPAGQGLWGCLCGGISETRWHQQIYVIIYDLACFYVMISWFKTKDLLSVSIKICFVIALYFQPVLFTVIETSETASHFFLLLFLR